MRKLLIPATVLALVAVAAPAARAQRLVLPAMRMNVSLPDATPWTVEARDIGGGRMADVVTGYSDGGSFWFMVTRADNLTCHVVMSNAAQRSGARAVGGGMYAPALEDPAVETDDGVAMFCLPMPGAAAIFSLQPSRLTGSQQVAVRRLAEAIRAGGGDAAGAALPAGAAELALTTPLWLSQLGLTVPVNTTRAWTAGLYYPPNGSALDQISAPGASGARMAATLTHLEDGSITCADALGHFLTGNARLDQSSQYIPARWFSVTVATTEGEFACLPLARGILVASILRIDNDSDLLAMRVLLIGVQLAAHQRWGAP